MHRTSPNGGLRCQQSVLDCPGDLVIAGLALCWVSSQLLVSVPPRGCGVKLEPPQPRSGEEERA